MACGLIACLLPGFATAQDWSTQEARAAWLIGQYEGESIGFNAKCGAATALARLTLNPDTTYAVWKSPSANVADGVMRLATPAGQLEGDWRGKMPKFSEK